MSVREIVIDGIEPALDVSETDHHGYRELCKQALLILIQPLRKPIVKKIANLRSSHQIWSSLNRLTTRHGSSICPPGRCLMPPPSSVGERYDSYGIYGKKR